MSSLISDITIHNLDHDLDEIRVRTLKHIESKILVSFQQNQDIDFSAGDLVYHLIVWFNRKPPLETDSVLNLILAILKSKYADETIKFIKRSRLEQKINKIFDLFKESPIHKEIILNIKGILENYIESNTIYIGRDNVDYNFSIPMSNIDSENMLIQDPYLNNEYEDAWSVPNSTDLNSLNILSHSLTNSNTIQEIKNGLIYLRTALNDYPAEFFLQPPYIFKNVLQLCFKDSNFEKAIVSNLIYLTRAISYRFKKLSHPECYNGYYYKNSKDKPKNQISITSFCTELLKFSIQHLKEFDDLNNQNQIYCVYHLIETIFQIIRDESFDQYSKKVSLQSNLIDLGILAKYYRQDKKNGVYRMQYILIINVIAEMILIKSRFEIFQDNDSKIQNSPEIWYLEIQYALLDIALKKLQPSIYNKIEKVVALLNMENSRTEILLNCEDAFKPVIKILKNFEKLNGEEFIILASKAVDTLSIHRSLDFVKILFEQISDSMELLWVNRNLRKESEQIILRLLAHENVNIKRISYECLSNNMKKKFLQISNRKRRRYNPTLLYIPLTSKIIAEIICFGYYNEDDSITKNAEMILSLILQSKYILCSSWKYVLDSLEPNYPLLQVLASFDNDIGKLIFDLFHPDKGLGIEQIIKCNIRFLFMNDFNIRQEALSRLAYLLYKPDLDQHFLPKILEIYNILPNDLCLLEVPREPEKIFNYGIYDSSAIPALLEMLKTDDIEADLQKTCLNQLDFLCQDVVLNNIITKEQGWFLVYRALQRSLSVNTERAYPESSIPCISIFTKILFCNTIFRINMSDDYFLLILILRSLFLFYNDITMRQEASACLFLLLYSNYIVGTGKNITLPKHFEKIRNLPIKCQFHWNESCFKKQTPLEDLFLQQSISGNTNNNNKKTFSTLQRNVPSCEQKDEFSFNRSMISIEPLEPLYSVPRYRLINEYDVSLLQYIRFSFASSWFENFDYYICNKIDAIDYSNFPGNSEENKTGVIGCKKILEFDNELKLNTLDINLIKITSTKIYCEEILKKISNSTTEKNFLKSLSDLRLPLFKTDHNNLDYKEIIRVFKKFLVIKPNSIGDHYIFENCVELISCLIENEQVVIIEWILKIFSEQNCLLVEILSDPKISICLYEVVCKLIANLLKYCLKTIHMNNTTSTIKDFIYTKADKNSNKIAYNLFGKLFEYIFLQIENQFEQKNLDKLRYLLNLLQVITESKQLDFDNEYLIVITKKIMYILMSLKLFIQSGSYINTNCLLIIGNLMNHADELILEKSSIKFLSGLCSISDFEIRTLSLVLLSKAAVYLEGAKIILEELSYLPDGFHACSLTTLLDTAEVPIVRSVAGIIFANLLNHKVYKCDTISLHLSVAPLCTQLEPLADNNGIHLIKQLFDKYQFYTGIINSIENLTIQQTISEANLRDITTPTIMIAYCRILENYIKLCPDTAAKDFENEPFMMKIVNVIKIVPSCITSESLGVVGVICNLINTLHLSKNINKFRKNLSSDYEFVVVLIRFLNIKYYDIGNHENLIILTSILNTLKLFINETITYEIVIKLLSDDAENIIEVITFGLIHKTDINFQRACLDFLIALLFKNETTEINSCKTILGIFDSTNFQNDTGTEYIFQCLLSLFVNEYNKKKGDFDKKKAVCESIAILLKSSKRIRTIAANDSFAMEILKNINSIFENIPITSTEYIRKYGEKKKNDLLFELGFLYKILLYWFINDCMTNESEISLLSKVAIQTFQWINYSELLRKTFLKTLTVLSKNSVTVSKTFAAPITSFKNSILELVSKMVIAETIKIKNSDMDFLTLKMGLEILESSCNCIEARLLIIKMNTLGVFDKLYPIDMKAENSWNIKAQYWLKFYEIFTRNTDNPKLKHVYVLCALIAKAENNIRILCLKILRNMSFSMLNRAALLTSTDFQYVVKNILDDGNEEEKYTVIIMIWKLVSDSSKAKNIIKQWGIPSKLRAIFAKLNNEDEDNDLCNIISNILDYF